MNQKIKWLLFPGLNLHARLRKCFIGKRLGTAEHGAIRRVLDAGCGNGMLSYESWKKGNTVLGVSLKDEVQRNKELFNGYLGITEDRLEFRVCNLHDIRTLGLQFDEIICSEVLEHIKDDATVIQAFADVLRPGGTLHLCAPNAEHPHNAAKPLDFDERGGHVRPGYTFETYRLLLEPAGFTIVEECGIGGNIRQLFNLPIVRTNNACVAMICFLAAQPFLFLDSSDPAVPYSLYVRCCRKE